MKYLFYVNRNLVKRVLFKRSVSIFADPLHLLDTVNHKSIKDFHYVTTILNKTMSSESMDKLLNWQKKKKEKLGDEGFDDYMKSD